MTAAEFNRRDKAAADKLAEIGELENARAWLVRNAIDYQAEGAPHMTPYEWAELEMPVGIFGAILRFLQLD